jgi:hypothetical protein
VVITYRNGGQRREQWCEESVVVQDDSTPLLQIYIYEPDGSTDLIRWDEVASIKPAPDLR